ncbi:NAD(P)H-dependent glycerol-3-phosphate dehydrogenase [candidate division KSB1 bacterium]
MGQKINSKKADISVLGAGSWGTALTIMLANKGLNVKLWEFDKELSEQLIETRKNDKFLPGVILPNNIFVTNELDEAVDACDTVMFVVPSHVLRGVAKNTADCGIKDKKIISATKGIENDTLLRMSEVLLESIPGFSLDRFAVLSGPSFATEVARSIPTTVVAASENDSFSMEVQDMFMCPSFRVYANADVTGVELGGSLKNVMAIAAGIIDGIGWGDNTKAAMVTRAIVEMTRLGVKMGAKQLTFSGLAGVGDLILTCMGKHSRNLHVGREIGKGKSLEVILNEMVMVAEGVKTTKSVHQLTRKLGVETPIMEKAYEILFENKPPKDAVIELMTREAKTEHPVE